MNTYDLEDVDVLELSLVDVPANQHAAVVLVKSLGYNPLVKPKIEGVPKTEDGSVTVEELTKKLAAAEAQVTDLTKKLTDAETAKEAAEASRAALVKSAEEAGLDVDGDTVTKRATPEIVMIDGEPVEKSLVPAPVLKALLKLQADAEVAELTKRGETELPNLAGTPLVKGRLLKAVDADMLAVLKAADAAMAEKMKELGHAKADDGSSPEARLNAMAKARAEATGVSFEKAYADVVATPAGAELLTQQRQTAN